MGVVIQVGAGAGSPGDDAVLDEWDKRRDAETGGRQRARQADADGDVVFEHALREQLTDLAQPRRVVRQERTVDEVGDRDRSIDRARIDAWMLAEASLACGHCFRSPGCVPTSPG